MLAYLVVFLFFLIMGIQLLRGKCQWLVIGKEDEPDTGKLEQRGTVKSRRARAIGMLFLFCALCVLLVAIGTFIQKPWVGRLTSAFMIIVLLVGLIFIASSNKLRR